MDDRATGGVLDSSQPVSADGRFVVFESDSADLVADDTNLARDVFVRDRSTGLVERVSVRADGTQAGNSSYRASISGSGRFVAFISADDALVTGMAGEEAGIYVRDRESGRTHPVSVNLDGSIVRNGNYPALSHHGRYVAFTSDASDLAAGDANGVPDVFVRDRQSNVTELVSLASNGEQGNCYSYLPSISAHGRYVAFISCADNLVPNDGNHWYDIFVHDRETGTTERVSIDSSGRESAGWVGDPYISADGRYVAFWSDSALVADDTNETVDCYLRDRGTGVTERVSVDSEETQSNGDCFFPTISADGRHVAFWSNASNLTPEGFRGGIFVRDRETGVTHRASVDSRGGPTHLVGRGAISGDGSVVVFDTDTPLERDDLNRDHEAFDVYAHELGGARTPTFGYTVKPDSLSFGRRQLGTKVSLSFWLRNTGQSSLPIVSITVTGPDREVFSRSRDCFFVFPGDSCRIRVTLNARSLGDKQAQVKVIAGMDTIRIRPVTATVVPAP